MGDFNPHAPTVLGMESRPGTLLVPQLTVNNAGFVSRFRGQAGTISHVHTYLQDVDGAPGLGVEIVDALAPTPSDEVHYPGSNTNAQTFGWATLSAGTPTYAAIDDQYNETDGLYNFSALNFPDERFLMFSGADAALSGKRIDTLEVWARLKLIPAAGSSGPCRVRGVAVVGGQTFVTQAQQIIPVDGLSRTFRLSHWRRSPATRVPWTQAEVNGIVTATPTTDQFGLVVDFANIPAQMFQVYGMWTNVTVAAENRRGYFYQDGQPRSGWSRNALTTALAESNNVSYWLLIYALHGSSGNQFSVPILWDKTATIVDDPTAVGEHRMATFVKLAGPSGLIAAVQADVPGTFLPNLLEQSGTILSQSQPFVEKFDQPHNSVAEALIPNRGQELTSAGGTVYAGVSVPIAWGVPSVQPAQPLVVEVRYGAGASTGGGTLWATATFRSDTNPQFPNVNPDFADTFIKFDGGNAVAPAAKLYAFFKSACPPNADWATARLQDRSDAIGFGAGTTAAQVDGQTFGGTTDSYIENNVEHDDWEIPVALIQPPAAPANPTAVVRSAT